MKPHVLETGDITPEQYALFLEMRAIFERLPDFDLPMPVSCHMICRAFAENFSVECVDGHFSRGCDHSWLVLGRKNREEHGEDTQVIADMYPVAGAAPFLVYTFFLVPWSRLYIEDPSVTASFRDAPAFLECVGTIATAIDGLRRA